MQLHKQHAKEMLNTVKNALSLAPEATYITVSINGKNCDWFFDDRKTLMERYDGLPVREIVRKGYGDLETASAVNIDLFCDDRIGSYSFTEITI